MTKLISTTSHILRFYSKLALFWIICLVSLFAFLIFNLFATHSTDPNFGSVIVIRGENVPLFLFERVWDSFELVMILLAAVFIKNTTDFLLNGQFLQAIIARNKDRLVHISSYLLSLFFLSLIISLGMVAIAFIQVPSVFIGIQLIFIQSLPIFAFTLCLILICNIPALSRSPFIYFLLIFFAAPGLLSFLSRLAPTSTSIEIISEISYYLNFFFGIFFKTMSYVSSYKKTLLLDMSEFFKAMWIVIPFVAINMFLFWKKDLN